MFFVHSPRVGEAHDAQKEVGRRGSSVTILKIPNVYFFNITSVVGKAALSAFLLHIMHLKEVDASLWGLLMSINRFYYLKKYFILFLFFKQCYLSWQYHITGPTVPQRLSTKCLILCAASFLFFIRNLYCFQ